MSLSTLYTMSRRSLSAHTARINVAGQNIANANTPGYTRRRLTLAAEGGVTGGLTNRTSPHFVGSGVTADRLERMRDGLLANAANDARSGLGGAEEEARLLSALEGTLGVGGGGSLQDVMAGFWNGWSDLADNPTDTAARNALLGQAGTVVDAINGLGARLSTLAGETRTALADSVDEVNGLLDEVAALNVTIQNARAAGSPDLAAEDQRDAVVAQLSEFAPIRVSEGADGYTLKIGGMAVVEGDQALGLRLDLSPGEAPTVRFGGTDVAFRASSGGRLGALVGTLGETIPATREALDGFVAKLVTDVNALHSAGHGLDGSTGLNFFDPAGLGAGTLRLSADVADPASIAAAGAPDAPGDSDTALAIGGLREGFDERAITLFADVGTKLSAATSAARGHAAVVDHLASMERGVSGVSLDEEMTHMIEAQHAFAAAARVLTTADEMMNTLLAL